jgi:hypothetical protein
MSRFGFVFAACVLWSVAAAHHDIAVDCTAPPQSGALTSVTAARDYIRALQPLNASVRVVVSGDCVFTAAGFTLDAALDSAPAPHTITYAGSNATGRAGRLLGGLRLPASGFTPSARGANVLQFNLSTVGFDAAAQLGAFHNGGLSSCRQTRAELFVGGVPMEIARFPNVAVGGGPWMEWLNVYRTVAARKDAPPAPLRNCVAGEYRNWRGSPDGGPCAAAGHPPPPASHAFLVNDSRALRWEAALQRPGSDVWLHGFWANDWADNYVRLVNVSTGAWKGASYPQLTYSNKTQPAYTIHGGARFYIVNLLEELDFPGEYFVDAATNTLYFYPPTPLAAAGEIFLSVLAEPIIAKGSYGKAGAALTNVAFEALSVQYGKSHGVAIYGADNVVLRDMTVSNVGLNGVELADALRCRLHGVVSSGAGCSAIAVSGGDHLTLAPSGIEVVGCDLSFYARWTRTYNPGVKFEGVGITVNYTRISNAPHNGLLGGGNNHMFAHNQLRDLCYEVRDSGAFYVGRSWVDRGMVLYRNTFTDIASVEPTVRGSKFVQAMYFDDEQSGMLAVENTCVNRWNVGDAQPAVQSNCFIVGGGRDNTVRGNTCKHLSGACIHFGDRGLNWQKALCRTELYQQLRAVNYQQPPYSTAYPRIVDTLQDLPCTPVGNAFDGNAFCAVGSGLLFIDGHTPAQARDVVALWHSTMANNTAFSC